jgi:hypothetical protein
MEVFTYLLTPIILSSNLIGNAYNITKKKFTIGHLPISMYKHSIHLSYKA